VDSRGVVVVDPVPFRVVPGGVAGLGACWGLNLAATIGNDGSVVFLVGLALLEAGFSDGEEKCTLVVVLLAVCTSWGVFVGKDVASKI